MISFGPFTLLISERQLLKAGVPVQIGARALDILIILIERAGTVVTKQELLVKVWKNLTVDEGSLRVRLVELRRILGQDENENRCIVNVHGQGYCFVAPLRQNAAGGSSIEAAVPAEPRTLPFLRSRVIGREDTMQSTMDLLLRERFVTIVGPGGIGKTTLAVTIGNQLEKRFDGVVHFVDLGLIDDPALVPCAIASTLGLGLRSNMPLSVIINFLRSHRHVLILDSCEHLIERAAEAARAIFLAVDQTHILTTSREPLRVAGEQIIRLNPFSVPPEEEDLSAEAALRYPAIEFFVERVLSRRYDFEFAQADVATSAEICRSLDGNPLAIALAAARVDTYGIKGVAQLLEDRFSFLVNDQRYGVRRHHSLAAVLDWSYDLLAPATQTLLQNLSVFSGSFSLKAVFGITLREPDRTIEALSDLVHKSLREAEISLPSPRYRLLDTTREYLKKKFAERSNKADIHLLHANYYKNKSLGSLTSEDLPIDSHERIELILNVRAALVWRFSDPIDTEECVSLAAAAMHCLIEASLLTQVRTWAEKALALLDDARVPSHEEMQLRAALALALLNTAGSAELAQAAIARTLQIAKALGDAHLELGYLGSLFIYYSRVADLRQAHKLAESSHSLSQIVGRPDNLPSSDWMFAITMHFTGCHQTALEFSKSAIRSASEKHRHHVQLIGYDYQILPRLVLARTLWLQGYPEQALAAARELAEFGLRCDTALSICLALIWQITVLLWVNEHDIARDALDRLMELTEKYSLASYSAVGTGLRGVLLVNQGDLNGGIQLIKESLERLTSQKFDLFTTALTSELANALLKLGDLKTARTLVEYAIQRVGRNGEDMYLPELFRIKGEILAAGVETDFAIAEKYFLQSLRMAREQGALSYEIRTALSLGRLWSRKDRVFAAVELVASVSKRFDEGFETADLKAASIIATRLPELHFAEQRRRYGHTKAK